MAVRLAQELRVELLDIRVFVGLADRLGFILGIQPRRARRARIDVHALVRRNNRLAAAVDAAARAGHDLHERIARVARLDALNQLLRRAGAVGHGHLQLLAAQREGRFLDARQPANLVVFHVLHGAVFQHVGGGAQRRLHHAAGHAEDRRRAGGLRHQLVKAFLIRQAREVDARVANHARQLARGEGDVHGAHAVDDHLRALGFKLLGGARHHRDDHDVRRVDAGLFGVVGLDDRAFHLHRGFAGGHVGDHLWEVVLQILDPSRRAGGEHRQHAAVLDAAQQLGRFLHDGQIRAEIGVKHLVKAQTAQRLRHLAGDAGADGQAEFLAQRHADGRSGLHDDELLRVGERIPDLVRVVALAQRADRAGVDALAAEHAVRLQHGLSERRGDHGLKAAVHRADRADLLHIAADGHAAAAQDALVRVADDGRGEIIQRIMDVFALEAVLVHAQLLRQILKLAVLAAHAGEALALVVGEDQLQHGSARLAHLRGVRLDDHALGYGHHAGRRQRTRADVHHAHAAGADLVDVLEPAEGRDLDTGSMRRLENGGAFLHGNRHTVDSQMNHCHVAFSLLRLYQEREIAPNLHFSMQTPHLRHFVVSMRCASRTVPLMQPAGQPRAHSVQPLHFAGSI